MTNKELFEWQCESIEQAVERIEQEEGHKLTGWVTLPKDGSDKLSFTRLEGQYQSFITYRDSLGIGRPCIFGKQFKIR